MKRNLLFPPLCGWLICLSSAAFSQKEFYIPKALVMPLHDRAQQLSLCAGIGGGLNANLSYSVTNHLALFATGTVTNGTRRRTSLFGDRYNIVKHDRAMTYGAGYFTSLKGKLNILEAYAGYGTYTVDNDWYFTGERDLGDNITQARYHSVFCQAAIGRKTVTYEYGFAGRLAYSHYSDVLFYDTSPGTDYERSRYQKFGVLTIDPAACFGYRIRNLSVNVQAGISVPLSSSRRTVENTFTTFFNGDTQVTMNAGTETYTTFAPFGRVSLQYDFDFGRRK